MRVKVKGVSEGGGGGLLLLGTVVVVYCTSIIYHHIFYVCSFKIGKNVTFILHVTLIASVHFRRELRKSARGGKTIHDNRLHVVQLKRTTKRHDRKGGGGRRWLVGCGMKFFGEVHQ